MCSAPHNLTIRLAAQIIMLIINKPEYKSSPITYMPHDRFSAIYEMLRTSPSWEVAGEKINGKSITEQEIRFVSIKGRLTIS